MAFQADVNTPCLPEQQRVASREIFQKSIPKSFKNINREILLLKTTYTTNTARLCRFRSNSGERTFFCPQIPQIFTDSLRMIRTKFVSHLNRCVAALNAAGFERALALLRSAFFPRFALKAAKPSESRPLSRGSKSQQFSARPAGALS